MGMSLEERKKKFFYAQDEALIYDYTVEITQPYFFLMHDTVVNLLEFEYNNRNDEINVLDIGSGTGIGSIKILEKFPNANIIAVDFSKPMNLQFRQKIKDNYNVKIIKSDFLDSQFNPIEELKNISLNAKGFDCVVTAFTFQHFDSVEKEQAYSKVYNCLKSKGILVNCDIFGYSSEKVFRFADELGLNWMISNLTEETTKFNKEFSKISKYAEDIKSYRDKWLQHWENDNILFPIRETTNQCSENLNEIRLLKNAGFNNIELFFRYWLAGILCAVK